VPPDPKPPGWRDAWARAQRFWDASVALSAPIEAPDDRAIAWIDLSTRQTCVAYRRLAALGLSDRLYTLYAHEVGHHIRYPHTLLRLRRLQLFLRQELPALLESRALQRQAQAPPGAGEGRFDFLLNLFLDILINHHLAVGAGLEDPFLDDIVALYRGLVTDANATLGFVMAVYESLWSLPEGELVSPAAAAALGRVSSRWRTEAAELGRALEAEAGRVFNQLAVFLLFVCPYLVVDGAEANRAAEGAIEGAEGVEGMGGELSPSELRRLLAEPAEVAEARRRLRGTAGAPAAGGGSGGVAGFPSEGLMRSLRGIAPPLEVALAWYRQTSRRADIVAPAALEEQAAVVPGPAAPWELGDDLGAIDWTGSIIRSGLPVPGLTTVQRTFLPDDPVAGETLQPWVEIYVDSSGSMPDPSHTLNPQVLAGFALVRCATEAGGRVRVIQYSSAGSVKEMADFTASAEPAYRALMEYIGGGTSFPFHVLARSVARHRRRARVFRVVLSDDDFLYNVDGTWPRDPPAGGPAPLPTLTEATQRGERFIAVLVARVSPEQRRALEATGVELLLASGRDDLLAIAQELGRRLFPPPTRPPGGP